MKTAEINSTAEMQTVVAEARSQELTVEGEAVEMQSEVRELEQVLTETEAAAENREQAEREGAETKERINEAVA